MKTLARNLAWLIFWALTFVTTLYVATTFGMLSGLVFGILLLSALYFLGRYRKAPIE